MKVAERHFDDDGRLIISQTHDATATLDNVRMLRDSGKRMFADSKCVGAVPGAMVGMWAKEAGILMSDTEALEEVVMRKLMDGEFSKFRVDRGRF